MLQDLGHGKLGIGEESKRHYEYRDNVHNHEYVQELGVDRDESSFAEAVSTVHCPTDSFPLRCFHEQRASI